MPRKLKCNVRGCAEPPLYRFNERIITCYEHGERFKDQYPSYKMLGNDTVESSRKKASIKKCQFRGCREEAVVLGKDDKLYCHMHGVPVFGERFEAKMEAGDMALRRAEAAALALVSSSSTSSTGDSTR